MDWYKSYPDEWREIIETVARELHKSESMIEKDVVQSMFLMGIFKVDYKWACLLER